MRFDNLDELLAPLSAAHGGSLLSKTEKLRIDPHTRVLFLGLGGLGCRTINLIKGVYGRDYAEAPFVRFLAVDSDERAMRRLCAGAKYAHPNAALTEEEFFSLYSPEAAHSLTLHCPDEAALWLRGAAVPFDLIHTDGARAHRAAGRLLLCGTGKYQALRTRISGLLDELAEGMTPADELIVVLSSGLFGGTGSAILADVCYLVRLLLRAREPAGSADVFGLFYTPEVMQSVAQIRKDPAVWPRLQANAYAAMKELDYFVSAGSDRPDAEPIYTLELPGGERVRSALPMLRAHRAFVISGDDDQTCDGILSLTALGLMNLLRTADGSPADSRSFLRAMTEQAGQTDSWRAKFVGRPASKLPGFLNYSFSSLGFFSLCFPRTEIIGYGAWRAMATLSRRWRLSVGAVTGDFVRQTAERFGLGSAEAIFRASLEKLGLDKRSYRLPKSGPDCPDGSVVPKEHDLILALGKAYHLGDVDDEAVLGGDLISLLLQPLVSFLTSDRFMAEFGPPCGRTLLCGDGNSHGGLCGLLEAMQDALAALTLKKEEALSSARSKAAGEICQLCALDVPPGDQIEEFLDLCERYSRAAFEYTFCRQYLPAIIRLLSLRLMQLASDAFEVCLPALDALRRCLWEDALMHSCLLSPANPPSFPPPRFYCTIPLDEKTVEHLIDRAAGPSGVDRIAGALAASLFNAQSQEIWANPQADPEAFREEIRSIFRSFTEPMAGPLLEQLAALHFCDPETAAKCAGTDGAPDLSALELAWETPEPRAVLVADTARGLVRRLEALNPVSFSVELQSPYRFPAVLGAVLINETPDLNRAIQTGLTDQCRGHYPVVAAFGDHYVSEYPAELHLVKLVDAFPLAMIKPIRDYAAAYFELSAGRKVQLHPDNRWAETLPELYGEQAEDWFFRVHGIPRLRP